MAQDADEATTAMIAMLLQQDAMAGGGGGGGRHGGIMSELSASDDSEDDYGQSRKRKKRKKKPVALRKKSSTAAASKTKLKATKKKAKENDGGNNGDNNNNAAADAGATGEPSKRRATPRRWDAAQEALFLEALELHGRDWKLCAQHIGHGREGRDVASHAQKYFIKLYKDNQALPAKVRESGEGYTLSGKPLDPNSAAARAYGLQGSIGQRQYRSNNKGATASASGGKSPAGPESDGAAVAAEAEQSTTCDPAAVAQATKATTGSSSEKLVEPGGALDDISPRERNDQLLRAMRANDDSGLQSQKVDHGPSKLESSGGGGGGEGAGATSSATAESADKMGAGAKRALAAHEKKMKREAARMEKTLRKRKEREAKCNALYDENGLTEYSRNRPRRRAATNYLAEPTAGLQFIMPTRYSGAPGAGERGSQPFIVHVHSLAYLLVDLHAHTTEAEVIGYLGGSWDADLNTLTVRAAYPGKSKIAGATECEMDPISEIEQRAAVEADGLQVVGWYHSHPTFEAIPSMCDVDNQTNLQSLFKDGRTGDIPFVALIMSPFNPDASSHKSEALWFRVDGPMSSRQPKRVETELICDDGAVDESTKARAGRVMLASTTCPKAIEMAAQWRDQVSYMDKARLALAEWLPPLVHKTAIRGKAMRMTQGVDSAMVRTALAGALGKSSGDQDVAHKGKATGGVGVGAAAAAEAEAGAGRSSPELNESQETRDSRQELETKGLVQELLTVPASDCSKVVSVK